MDLKTWWCLIVVVLMSWIVGALLCFPAFGATVVTQIVEVRASWQHSDGGNVNAAADGFILQRCGGSGCVDFVDVAAVGKTELSAVDFVRGDSGGVVYRYRVLAFNSVGRSLPSAIAEIRSPQILLLSGSPSGLIATVVGVALSAPGASLP